MDYAILILLIAMNSSQFIFSKLYNNRQKHADPYLCTMLIGATVFLFYAVYGQFKFTFDYRTLIYGLFFGCAYCLGYIFQIKALEVGEVSLTSLVLSYSLVVPILFGIIYYKDSVSVWFFVAFALLIAALFLINYEPGNKSENTDSKRNKRLWLLFAALAFLGNAFCVILQTLHQKSIGGQRFEFMAFAMSLVIVVNAVLSYFNNKKLNTTSQSFKKGWWCAIILGLLNGVTNLSYMILASRGIIPVSLLNSFISVGSLLLTFIFSLLIFREKLRKLQLVGFFIGLVSVFLFTI